MDAATQRRVLQVWAEHGAKPSPRASLLTRRRFQFAGALLFGRTSDTRPMRLVDSRTLADGVAFLTYERVRENYGA